MAWSSRTDMGDQKYNNKGPLILLSAASSVALVFVTVVALFIIPDFEDLLQEFQDIPFVAKLIFGTYKYWFLFPVITIFAGIDTYRREAVSIRYTNVVGVVFVLGLLVSLALPLASSWVFYEILFKLAEATQ